MPKEQLEWIELSDFTPGIFREYASADVTQPAPDGAAQPDGTYGCYAPATGGLAPIGGVIQQYEPKWPGEFSLEPDVADLEYVAITDMTVYSPAQALLPPDQSSEPDVMAIGTQWWRIDEEEDPLSRLYGRLAVVKHVLADAPEYEAFIDYTLDYAGLFQPNTFHLSRSVSDSMDPWEAGRVYIGMLMGIGQSGSGRHFLGMYPDVPGDLHATDSEYLIPTDDENAKFFGAFGHQGRYCAILHRNIEIGADVFATPNEELVWSPVNQVGSWTVPETGAVLVEENPTGFGVYGSANANELFLVKNFGGGVVVRGSLDNPTVIRLPAVASTYGVSSQGCVTPNGFVYGTRDGVYVWNGGDTSEKLSRQIDQVNFWQSGVSGRFKGHQSRFAYMAPFVYVGNGYLYDERVKSWWRLDNQDAWTPAFYAPTTTNKVWAAVTHFDLGQPVGANLYDMGNLRADFSWQSQPLQRTRRRELEFREIQVIAQGTGTITITLTGLGGATCVETITVPSSSRPESVVVPTSLRAHDVVVRIESLGEDYLYTAPRVYAVRLGYDARGGV
jgi:hypothetical protein